MELVPAGPDGQAGAGPASQVARLKAIASSFSDTYRTAEEVVVAFVREAIMQGMYRPGERLPQDVIAELLGMSRIPLRAGLRQLEEEGLVTISPHRGTVVTTLQPAEIREIYELRVVLECYLLERALPELTPGRLGLLRASAAIADAARADSERVDSRIAFYDELYSLARRPRALKLVSRLRGEVSRYLLGRRAVEEPAAHLALLEHLERGDLQVAQAWLRLHLAEVAAKLEAIGAEAMREGDRG